MRFAGAKKKATRVRGGSHGVAAGAVAFWPTGRPRGLIRRRAGHRGFAVDGVSCRGELGANLTGVGVVQVVEDGQRLPPGIPGLPRVAGGVVGVAEVGEDLGLVGAVG